MLRHLTAAALCLLFATHDSDVVLEIASMWLTQNQPARAVAWLDKEGDATDPAFAEKAAKLLADNGQKQAAEKWAQIAFGNRDAVLNAILNGKDGDLPASVLASREYKEVREFVKNGEPFHAITREGFSIQGGFDGTIHFTKDSIIIDVDKAVLWTHPQATEKQPVTNLSIQLGYQTFGDKCCWNTDAESNKIAIGSAIEPGKPLIPPVPMHFTIPRTPGMHIDRHWLVFAVESEFGPDKSRGWCYGHSDRFLLSNDEARLPGQLG